MRRSVAVVCGLGFALSLLAGCQAAGEVSTTGTPALHPGGPSTTAGPHPCVDEFIEPDAAPVEPRRVDDRLVGAAGAGPLLEPKSTIGEVVTPETLGRALRNASEGDMLRLRSGCYDGFDVPEGVSVAPYGGEPVVVQGQLNMESGAAVSGLVIRSESQWAVRVHTTDSEAMVGVVIRNNDIAGGTIEAIRVSGNVAGVLIEGNLISHGGNHGIKVHGDDTGYLPSATVVGNYITDPEREDSIQVEDAGHVLVSRNTLAGAPEDNLDVKSGVVEVVDNLFLSAGEGSLLVHGSGIAEARGNVFDRGGLVAVGSRESSSASLILEGNLLLSADIVLRRTSQPIVISGNTIEDGVLTVGFADGDIPSDVLIAANVLLGTSLVDNVASQGGNWRCERNEIAEAGPGWPPDCA